MEYEKVYSDKNKSYFTHQRPELLPYIPANISSALDVGCGDGTFGLMLKHHSNCEVWGIEPNKDAAHVAEDKLDVVINGFFDKDLPQLKAKKFDAIFFNDVLEHLTNPDQVLLDCKDLLNDNGYIIASIPNIRWYPVVLSLLRYKDFKYQLAGVMDKTHMRFFTAKSMVRMFEETGYKVLKIQGINKDRDFRVFNLINFLLFNTQEDMKYPQFVLVTTKAS